MSWTPKYIENIIKAAVNLQAFCDKRSYLLPFINYKRYVDSSYLYCHPPPPTLHIWNSIQIHPKRWTRYSKQSCRLGRGHVVCIFSKKELSLRNCSELTYESTNFSSSWIFDLLWVAGSERLFSKASLSKTRKTSKDKKTFTWALLNGCSEKIREARGKCLRQSPVLIPAID